MAEVSGLSSSIASLFEDHSPNQEVSKGDALDRDSFLLLLTTQLQNQNPLEPMNNEQFIQQLTQFSSLEQMQNMNSTLEAVYVGIAAMNNASMASLLGTSIVAVGSDFAYSGEGDIELQYSAPEGTQDAVLSVYDDSGALVYTSSLGDIDGEGSHAWDGRDFDGNPVPEGVYSFTVSGVDQDGNSVDVEERVSGTITEMDYSTGTPLPSINGAVVELSEIIRLTTGDEE